MTCPGKPVRHEISDLRGQWVGSTAELESLSQHEMPRHTLSTGPSAHQGFLRQPSLMCASPLWAVFPAGQNRC